MNFSRMPGVMAYPVQRYPEQPVAAVEKAEGLQKRAFSRADLPELYGPLSQQSRPVSRLSGQTGQFINFLA